MTLGKNAEQQGMTDSQNPHEEDVQRCSQFHFIFKKTKLQRI